MSSIPLSRATASGKGAQPVCGANLLDVRSSDKGSAKHSQTAGISSPTTGSPSFIAKIEGLKPNYHIQPNRSTENKNGFFVPPDRRTAYDEEGAVYLRWHGGRMSRMQTGSLDTTSLVTKQSAATIFSQKDDTDHLLAVNFNALLKDVASYDPGWRVISFDHLPQTNTSATYSSINILGEERHLAADGSPVWMGQLLPHVYNYQRTTPGGHPIASTTISAGLIGSLPILIGLAAFSAPKDSLIYVLSNSVAPRAWRRHNLPTGRTPERGMVVTIYYDPTNHLYSNEVILDRIEKGHFGPFYA